MAGREHFLKTIIPVAVLFMLCRGQGWTAERAVYHYGPEKSELTGTVIRKMFYGPPGYGEDPERDRKEYGYILRLEKPVRVMAAGTDSHDENGDNIREMQVDYSKEIPLENYLDKKVRIRGTLRLPESGHDHTDVMITPEDVLPADGPPAGAR